MQICFESKHYCLSFSIFLIEKKTVDETIPITQIPKLLFHDRGRLFNHIIRDTLLWQSYDLSFGSLSSSGI